MVRVLHRWIYLSSSGGPDCPDDPVNMANEKRICKALDELMQLFSTEDHMCSKRHIGHTLFVREEALQLVIKWCVRVR